MDVWRFKIVEYDIHGDGKYERPMPSAIEAERRRPPNAFVITYDNWGNEIQMVAHRDGHFSYC